ncbi:radical SAM protein [Pseudomonas sp. F1_0610]|uniref:radical SAM protein n=1 Tax=Pseudomonas sp. F1_0610 TaxID=3114284 RepID=UPI0039C2D0A5
MSRLIEHDKYFIAKEAESLPSYTVYPRLEKLPTLLKPNDLEYARALKHSRLKKKPLALYIYIPFCPSNCFTCDRFKISSKDRSRSTQFLNILKKEIVSTAKLLDKSQVIEQLFIGGGNPTFFNHQEFSSLLSFLKDYFNIHSDNLVDYEIKIDPRESDWSTVALLRELGFNRILINIQTLNPIEQTAINRLHTLNQVQTLVDAARTLEYRSICLTLMYGLPKQTRTSYAESLDKIIALQPDRIGAKAFLYDIENSPVQRFINKDDLPSEQLRHEMYLYTFERLTSANYSYLGQGLYARSDDNYGSAKEDDRLKINALGYSDHGHCDLIGFGPNAITQTETFIGQNTTNLSHYYNLIENGHFPLEKALTYTADDIIRRDLIEQIQCHGKLDIKKLNEKYNIAFEIYFKNELSSLYLLEQKNLLSINSNLLILNSKALHIPELICQIFDHYQSATQSTNN